MIAFNPDIVRKPVVQKPRSTTSPRPNEGKIPKITANKYDTPHRKDYFI